ncbi:hypothetical protein ABIC49_004397 [Burkholderia ambifaria]
MSAARAASVWAALVAVVALLFAITGRPCTHQQPAQQG